MASKVSDTDTDSSYCVVWAEEHIHLTHSKYINISSLVLSTLHKGFPCCCSWKTGWPSTYQCVMARWLGCRYSLCWCMLWIYSNNRGESWKVRVCNVLSCTYVCSMWSLGDLATSFVPPLHSFACPCNPHVLTYAMFTSPHLHKLWNAHLPEPTLYLDSMSMSFLHYKTK